MYNNIKRILVITLMLVIAIPSLKAQNQRGSDPRAKYPKKTTEERAKILSDTLSSVIGLSADQYQKVYASNLKYLNEKDRIKSSGNMETGKTDVIAALKMRKQEIAAVLTPDQKTKWMSWKKDRRAQMQLKREQMQGQKSAPQGTAPSMPMDDLDGM